MVTLPYNEPHKENGPLLILTWFSKYFVFLILFSYILVHVQYYTIIDFGIGCYLDVST
jgi:hypothetical protein